MRRQIGNAVSVTCSFVRLTLLKLLNRKVKFSQIERISPNVVFEVSRRGTYHLGKMVCIHSGSKIKVRDEAELRIGDGVKINYNCMRCLLEDKSFWMKSHIFCIGDMGML